MQCVQPIGSQGFAAKTGLVSVLCLLAATLPLLSADVSVRVSLDPPQIELGRAAQLTIEVSGAGTAKLYLPQVENLDIAHIGEQSSYQWVNGLSSQKIFYLYQVTPNVEGQYVIPAFQVEAGGQKLTTTPLTLKVGQGGQTPSPTPNTAVPVPSGPLTTPTVSTPAPTPTQPLPAPARTVTSTPKPGNDPIMLQVVAPKTEVYVGQLLPVTLKLYLRANLQAEFIQGDPHSILPFLTNDAFTANPPKNIEQLQETIDGILYKVVIWNVGITPVKAGDYSLVFEENLRVAEQARQRRPSGFDDPFFDAVFSQSRMVEHTFSSAAQTWKVLPLPTEGKPDNFSGAVGDFALTIQAQPAAVKVGEPINLEMTIEGKGNFDRVNAPALSNTDGLKAYSPSSKIDLSDEIGFEGKKVFTEAVIPMKVTALPQVSFSYFNPDVKQYVTRMASVPHIAITDAPASAMASSGTAKPAPTVSPDESNKQTESTLVPIKVYLTPFAVNFQPVFLSPGFITAQGIPLVALLAGFVVARRRKRLESDPDFARAHETNRAVRLQLEAMNSAVTRNDSAAFFTAARRAVQHRLAERWRVKAEDVTFDLISQRSSELAESLKSLFLVADEISYSGEGHSEVSLAEWQSAIVALLSRLEKKI